MVERGRRSRSRIAAVIGPAICRACYEVPAGDARRGRRRRARGARDLAHRHPRPRTCVAAVAAQLAAAGVGRIDAVGGCTAEDAVPLLLPPRRRTGRFAMLAWIARGARDRRRAPAELAANLAAVEERIADACAAAGRDRAEVTLVVVTKTWPAEDVRRLASLGVVDVGENRDQEAAPKARARAPTSTCGGTSSVSCRPTSAGRWRATPTSSTPSTGRALVAALGAAAHAPAGVLDALWSRSRSTSGEPAAEARRRPRSRRSPTSSPRRRRSTSGE